MYYVGYCVYVCLLLFCLFCFIKVYLYNHSIYRLHVFHLVYNSQQVSMPEQFQSSQLLLFSLLTLFCAFIFYLIGKRLFRISQIHEYISHLRRRRTISRQVTFIAIDLNHLFLSYSDVYKPHHTTIRISTQSLWQNIKTLYRKARYFFTSFAGYSPCYALRFTPKAIRKFFSQLRSIDQVKTVIYTTLQPQITQQIMQEINLAQQFPQSDRIFASTGRLSADDIDHDTGRVIIVAGKSDLLDKTVGSHHGLVLSYGQGTVEEQQLTKLLCFFSRLLQNGRVQNLHDDMFALAWDMNLPIDQN